MSAAFCRDSEAPFWSPMFRCTKPRVFKQLAVSISSPVSVECISAAFFRVSIALWLSPKSRWTTPRKK